jgi:fusion protein PurCD
MTQQFTICVLASGKGSSLQSIIDSIESNVLNCKISCVITNTYDINSPLFEICNDNQLCYKNFKWDKSKETRERFEEKIIEFISNNSNVDLVVCAGWNHVLTQFFLSTYNSNVINLHPALPGTFIGLDCIKKAFDSFQRGEIKYTGSMVHYVIPDVDKGSVIQTIKVPIYKNDTYEKLETRQKIAEKGILISSIQQLISNYYDKYIDFTNNSNNIYNGKVRDVCTYDNNLLVMMASDRLSAFDIHVCDISGKGEVLNNMSAWWFDKTKHIIPNHYLWHSRNAMIVQKTKPIKLEIIIRGYLTGSSATSIYTMYEKGERILYDISFPDGLKKNQKLPFIAITPTTKGEKDIPITPKQIVNQKYLTLEEYNFISNTSMQLFNYGSYLMEQKGLILVDTKYEFGKLPNGEIILIDELHTCDSSRFWIKDTYEERFNKGIEPEKLDKDIARDYIKKNFDIRNNKFVLPKEIKQKSSDAYQKYYNYLTNDKISDKKPYEVIEYKRLGKWFIDNIYNKIAVILAGSTTDSPFVQNIEKCLTNHNIYFHTHFSSAHKNTIDVMNIIDSYEKSDKNIVYITVAGRSNALSGVVAANSSFPVIACPPFKDKTDMFTNINSSLQCPSKVPVMTILEPDNVAISIERIFNMI